MHLLFIFALSLDELFSNFFCTNFLFEWERIYSFYSKIVQIHRETRVLYVRVVCASGGNSFLEPLQVSLNVQVGNKRMKGATMVVDTPQPG